jgi:hypothetical protein
MFLELGTSDCWVVRETTAGELTSVLFGLCAGVDRAVLDPLPGSFADPLMDLASMGRQAFMESYLKDEETSPLATGSGHRRRQGDVIARRATLERGQP